MADSWKQRAIDAEKRLEEASESEETAEEWKEQAEAYRAVLEAADIPLDEDGALDPDGLEDWQSRRQADAEKARAATLNDAGFPPESGEGVVLGQAIANGEIEPGEDQTMTQAVAAFAESQYGWAPKTILTHTESQSISDSQRLSQIQGAGASEDMAPPSLDDQIADAQAAGNNQLARELKQRAVIGNMLAADGKR